MNTKSKRISAEMIREWLNRPIVEIRFTIEMLVALALAMAAAAWLAAIQ